MCRQLATYRGRRQLAASLIVMVFLVACGKQTTPTETPTETARPTDTAAPVDTLLPTDTPVPTGTPLPTDTPAPTSTAAPTLVPTSTPRPTPTPPGYFGDPENGWSIRFPSDWEAVEEEEQFPALVIKDPGQMLYIMVGWDYYSGEETLEETADMFSEYLTAEMENVEIATQGEMTLKDGTPAYSITAVESDIAFQVQIVVAQRGARVYVVVVSATTGAFKERARTIDAIIGSLALTPLKLYDVDRENALVLGASDPYDWDPATTESSAAGAMGYLFGGLVALNTDLQVVPDLAQRWEISADGRTYTFHLHPDAVFHDGRPVTAADVKYSWERAAHPDTGSPKTSVYLGDVLGVHEMLNGQADEISGVVALDDHTLQVTIDAPKVYFLAKLTWPAAYVVDRENASLPGASEELGEEWWREPNGSGPFRVEKWEDDVIIFARNDAYYGPAPRLAHIVYLIDAGPSFQLYESGEIDMAGVPSSLVERVEDPDDPLHDELHTIPDFCTSRVIFDADQPPFDDPLVRQAFSYAVDQDKILQVVLKGTSRSAAGPLPPGMPGYSPDLVGYSYDPDRARALIAQSSYGDPANLPPITLTDSGYTEPGPRVAALIETWEDVFGIQIEVELLEPRTYVQEIREGHGQILMMGWCADYPDPENFLDLLYHSESEENLGHYHNPEVDALLEQARTEEAVAVRLALYRQVEQMIVDDAPAAWISHSVSRVLLKPYVHNYVLTPLGVQQAQYIYLDPH